MFRNVLPKLFLLLIVSLFLASCTSPQPTLTPVGEADSVAGTWRLTSPASAYPVSLSLTPVLAPLAGFFGLDIRGEGPVNSYFTTASFSKGPSIESSATGTGQVSAIGATQRGGTQAAMQAEDLYFSRLAAVNRVELTSADQLRLSYGGPSPGVLVYERQ